MMVNDRERILLKDIAELKTTTQKLKDKIDLISRWLNSKFDILPADIKDALSYDDLDIENVNKDDTTDITTDDALIQGESRIAVGLDSFTCDNTVHGSDSEEKDNPLIKEEIKDECVSEDDNDNDNDFVGRLSLSDFVIENDTDHYNQSEPAESLDGNDTIANRSMKSMLAKTLMVVLHDINESNEQSTVEEFPRPKRKTYQAKINELLDKSKSDGFSLEQLSSVAQSCTRFTNSTSVRDKNKLFHCHVSGCEKAFGRKHSFRSHMKYAHPDDYGISKKRSNNNIDGDDFSNNSSSVHSLSSTTTDRTQLYYECGICDKVFRTEMIRQNHVNKRHDKNKPFHCHYSRCGLTFPSTRSFKEHMKSVHRNGKSISNKTSNNIDGDDFSDNSSSVPLSSTTTDRTQLYYECGTCDKVFRTRTLRRNHLNRRHNKNKPFHCHYSRCGLTFPSTRSFKEHMKSVHPDYDGFAAKKGWKNLARDFKCSVDGCDKAYPSKSDLDSHEKQENHFSENSENNQDSINSKDLNRSIQCSSRSESELNKEEYTNDKHKPTFSSNLEFKCTFKNCSRTYSSEKSLNDHIYNKCHLTAITLNATKNDGDSTIRDDESGNNVKEEKQYDFSSDPNAFLFVCQKCGLGYESRELLNEHVLNSCFECKICRKSFLLKMERDKHLIQCIVSHRNRNKNKVKRKKIPKALTDDLYCIMCKKNFTVQSDWEEHMAQHTVKLFNCAHLGCRKKFTLEEEVEEHENTAHCQTCYRSFPHLAHFKVHNDKDHSGQAEFSTNPSHKNNESRNFQTGFHCSSCGMILETFHSMKNHVEQNCYKCTVCGRTWAKQRDLEGHMGIHAEKKFFCKTCGVGFSRKHTLQKHIAAKHTSEKKKFPCMYCDKVFISMVGYTKHVKIHDVGGIQRKQCTICGFDFACDNTLRKHIQAIHEKQRPYPCHLCEKWFKTSNARNYHVKTHDNPNGRKRGLNKDVDDFAAAAKRRKLNK